MPPIEVIYENGVFRPLQPIELAEGTRLEVIVIPRKETQPVELDQTVEATGPLVGEELIARLDEIAALPYTPHPDGRTDIAAHHDDILYPKHGKMP